MALVTRCSSWDNTALASYLMLYIILSASASNSNTVLAVMCWTITRSMAKPILCALSLLALAACASAPVQEMSDARQAIYSAEASGAAQHSSATLLTAQHLLREAQGYLESGAYRDARRYALDARKQAIKAREQATRNAAFPSAP